MSAFTPVEIAYLDSQFLGRLATVGPDGKPHVVPVAFRLNPELDTIDIGGHDFAKRKKYRDVLKNPAVALIVDDVPKPGGARAVEVRGDAEVLESGGAEIMRGFDDEMFRIRPSKIVSWGLESGGFSMDSRSVP
jgi:pyridoxamine 5'-phosphate oxidase family protein